jgi:hypothetical protein
LLGARTGGSLCVFAIGGDLFLCCHGQGVAGGQWYFGCEHLQIIEEMGKRNIMLVGMG